LDGRCEFDVAVARLPIERANEAICRRALGPNRKMGSTVTLLVIRDDRAIVAHVGDSRAYRMRDGQFEQLTTDHSLYNDLLRAGAPDMPPKHQFAMGNVITKVLGRPATEPDITVLDVRPGDAFLLCSDGVGDYIDEELSIAALSKLTPEEAVPLFIDQALVMGSSDNVTAVVAKVIDNMADARPTLNPNVFLGRA
ncbi:MAG: serine/threonine-protein phosphatase, partial [Myxococcales bacterium]|nr:serine/threonine-protein phosphatase [Myxococcales bacterium]